MSSTTIPDAAVMESGSAFWSPAGSWEIVLFAAGVLLTLAVVAFFIIVMVRASREPIASSTHDGKHREDAPEEG